MQLEPIDSSIIAFRGHDPNTQIMHIVFRDRKTQQSTSKYEYGNVSAELYACGCAQDSFGSWFSRSIKPYPRVHPYRLLEQQVSEDSTSDTIDFTSQQPLPVAVVETVPVVIVPADLVKGDAAPEEAREAAKEIVDQLATQTSLLLPAATPLVLRDEASYRTAGTTVLAIRAARNAFASVFDPAIAAAHREHKRLLALKNFYDGPLASDEDRLDSAMSRYRLQQRQDAENARQAAQRVAELEAEEEAKKKSIELQFHDALLAESRGDHELRDQILEAAPLPVAPLMRMPVYQPPAVPVIGGITVKDGWDFREEEIDMSKLPEHFIKRVPDVAAIRARVKSMGQHHGIPGVIVYPVSNQAKPRNNRKKAS